MSKEQREHDREVAKAAIESAKLDQQQAVLASPAQVVLYGKSSQRILHKIFI